MFYIMMDLNSHVETIVCGSICIVMYFTCKECDIVPYTDAYDTIKAVPIVQVATAYKKCDMVEYDLNLQQSDLDGCNKITHW